MEVWSLRNIQKYIGILAACTVKTTYVRTKVMNGEEGMHRTYKANFKNQGYK